MMDWLLIQNCDTFEGEGVKLKIFIKCNADDLLGVLRVTKLICDDTDLRLICKLAHGGGESSNSL